jgi:cell division protein FtsB
MAHQAREKKAVQLEIEALRQRNAQLEEQIVLLRTDINYIEKLARERYGMVREGEKLFRIKPEPSK